MKKFFFAGNWKSNKTLEEARIWAKEFSMQYATLPKRESDIQIILAVPFTLLSPLRQEFQTASIPIQLAAQDVSPFPEGAYTGAISARMMKEFADWVIIGHSERRKYFAETETILQEKVKQATQVGLHVIYCVQESHMEVPEGVSVVAYEPVWAIGTGKPDTPENANTVLTFLKERYPTVLGIYGGSVTDVNVASYMSQPVIDGVLPGGASMDPRKFFRLLVAASAV